MNKTLSQNKTALGVVKAVDFSLVLICALRYPERKGGPVIFVELQLKPTHVPFKLVAFWEELLEKYTVTAEEDMERGTYRNLSSKRPTVKASISALDILAFTGVPAREDDCINIKLMSSKIK